MSVCNATVKYHKHTAKQPMSPACYSVFFNLLILMNRPIPAKDKKITITIKIRTKNKSRKCISSLINVFCDILNNTKPYEIKK